MIKCDIEITGPRTRTPCLGNYHATFDKEMKMYYIACPSDFGSFMFEYMSYKKAGIGWLIIIGGLIVLLRFLKFCGWANDPKRPSKKEKKL
jgi:hypothetical protein